MCCIAWNTALERHLDALALPAQHHALGPDLQQLQASGKGIALTHHLAIDDHQALVGTLSVHQA